MQNTEKAFVLRGQVGCKPFWHCTSVFGTNHGELVRGRLCRGSLSLHSGVAYCIEDDSGRSGTVLITSRDLFVARKRQFGVLVHIMGLK